jgi:hypothetical protein
MRFRATGVILLMQAAEEQSMRGVMEGVSEFPHVLWSAVSKVADVFM